MKKRTFLLILAALALKLSSYSYATDMDIQDLTKPPTRKRAAPPPESADNLKEENNDRPPQKKAKRLESKESEESEENSTSEEEEEISFRFTQKKYEKALDALGALFVDLRDSENTPYCSKLLETFFGRMTPNELLGKHRGLKTELSRQKINFLCPSSDVMHTLPVEIQIHILSYCTGREILSLLRVSKDMYLHIYEIAGFFTPILKGGGYSNDQRQQFVQDLKKQPPKAAAAVGIALDKQKTLYYSKFGEEKFVLHYDFKYLNARLQKAYVENNPYAISYIFRKIERQNIHKDNIAEILEKISVTYESPDSRTHTEFAEVTLLVLNSIIGRPAKHTKEILSRAYHLITKLPDHYLANAILFKLSYHGLKSKRNATVVESSFDTALAYWQKTYVLINNNKDLSPFQKGVSYYIAGRAAINEELEDDSQITSEVDETTLSPSYYFWKIALDAFTVNSNRQAAVAALKEQIKKERSCIKASLILLKDLYLNDSHAYKGEITPYIDADFYRELSGINVPGSLQTSHKLDYLMTTFEIHPELKTTPYYHKIVRRYRDKVEYLWYSPIASSLKHLLSLYNAQISGEPRAGCVFSQTIEPWLKEQE